MSGQSRGSAGVVLGGTIVAGIAAYLVTWLVPRSIGFSQYPPFAVFWSVTYLAVAALSGIGQEFTRAVRPASSEETPSPVARRFAVVAAIGTAAVICASALLWAGPVFPVGGWSLVVPLAVGAAGYVLTAVVSGCFAGLGEWRIVALLMVGDAILRLVLIGAALIAGGSPWLLAWAVALPFPVTLLVLWPFVRRRVVGRFRIDVGYRGLIANSGRTLLAGVSMSVMITGLPLVISLSSHGTAAATVSLVILSVTLTRAPLVVVAQSLQGFLVVMFRSQPVFRPIAALPPILAALGLGGVLALAAALLGPTAFTLIFPGERPPDSGLLAVLIASSVLVALAFVAGALALARSAHGVYAAAWSLGAIITVIALVLPWTLEARVVAAVIAGPSAVVVVCVGYAVASSFRLRSS